MAIRFGDSLGAIKSSSLTATNINVTNQLLSAGVDLLNIFLTTSTNVENLSANWQSTYETVSTLSASWEESSDILPTVTNYLSTSNILLSALTVGYQVQFNNLPTLSSGLSTGSVWIDTAAGNVLKVVL